jgi:hypothetical protein
MLPGHSTVLTTAPQGILPSVTVERYHDEPMSRPPDDDTLRPSADTINRSDHELWELAVSAPRQDNPALVGRTWRGRDRFRGSSP